MLRRCGLDIPVQALPECGLDILVQANLVGGTPTLRVWVFVGGDADATIECAA